MDNVILIGMPGSGKTTLARAYAERYGLAFADCDELVCEWAGVTIPEIFAREGEAGFRRRETEALRELCARRSTVIATGGGCVTLKENVALLRKSGTVLWVRRSPEALATGGRPLSLTQDIGKMYELRRPLYESACDASIENNGTIGAALRQIAKRCRREGKAMIDQKLVTWGSSGNIIREIAEYGVERAKVVGAENVYNFTIGSPSIDPPPVVFETMERYRSTVPAAQLHTYAPAVGFPDVRQKVADYLTKTFGVAYGAKDIFITCGTSTCLAVLTRVLLSGGGRALTFTPYFMDYKYYAESVGSSLIECPTDPDTFQLDLGAAEKSITEDTVMLVINSPNNPSGVVLRREGLEGLAALLERKQKEHGHPIYIVADEPYRELVYDGQEVVYLPSIYKNTIYCYSFSKSMSLPGERVGFMALPPELDDYSDIHAACIAVIRAFGYICVSSMWQRVAVDCLGATSDIEVYHGNRDLLYDSLTKLGYTCVHPDGAFYLFMKTPEPDAEAFCRRAMKNDLLVVPGDSFGTPGYVRLAYCVSRGVIERSLPTWKALAEEYGLRARG